MHAKDRTISDSVYHAIEDTMMLGIDRGLREEKSMDLQYPFSDDTRDLFFWNQLCFWCGMNKWTDLHHILGRVSNSPLNACPIHNQRCHIGNGKLGTFEVQCKLLAKTFLFLSTQGYRLTINDKMFIRRFKNHYKQFLPNVDEFIK